MGIMHAKPRENDGPGPVDTTMGVVERHLERYPLMQPQDAYKLVYQGVMGPAHAVSDRGRAGTMLLAEMNLPDRGPDEPLIDPITPSGDLARVHLRPWMKAGLPVDVLLDAFMETPERFSDSRTELVRICDLLFSGDRSFGGDPREFLEGIRDSDYPPVHHSGQYRDRYRPSYRVVLAEFLPADLLTGAGN